jgi:hypothetical protein
LDVLLDVFGERLRFRSTVGRGDMSRGGLLIRKAARAELPRVAIAAR